MSEFSFSYRGVKGTISKSSMTGVFYGNLIVSDMGRLFAYEGNCLLDLEENFQDAVDKYLNASGGESEVPSGAD